MTEDMTDKKKIKQMLMDIKQLDKEYERLQDLMGQCDGSHVMLLLSTCLVQNAQNRGMDPETLLAAVCDVWNITEDSDEVLVVQRKASSSVMFPDKGVH